jgi:hypothetical protein
MITGTCREKFGFVRGKFYTYQGCGLYVHYHYHHHYHDHYQSSLACNCSQLQGRRAAESGAAQLRANLYLQSAASASHLRLICT